MAKTIKNLKQLKSAGLPTEQPPLQFEAPHAKMARINREMQQTTEALQALKREWAARNIKANQCRETIATSEQTHVETRKRELATHLLSLQTELGAINRELRARKVERQAISSQNHLYKPTASRRRMSTATA
jgi:hypothetical protein